MRIRSHRNGQKLPEGMCLTLAARGKSSAGPWTGVDIAQSICCATHAYCSPAEYVALFVICRRLALQQQDEARTIMISPHRTITLPVQRRPSPSRPISALLHTGFQPCKTIQRTISSPDPSIGNHISAILRNSQRLGLLRLQSLRKNESSLFGAGFHSKPVVTRCLSSSFS